MTGLKDLMLVIDFLAQTKTPPEPVAAAIERLREKAKRGEPFDAVVTHHEFTANPITTAAPKSSL